jgi:5'(3')-deoxyribonucleotidase
MGTPAPAPINVYLDSDGPVADFGQALAADGREADVFKHEPGIYLWLEVTPGARRAIEALKLLDNAHKIRVWILTKTPAGSPYAYTEKVLWYRRNFPWLEDRVIISHDKHLLGTKHDFLLDDRPHKANADKFRGTFVLFHENAPIVSWAIFMDAIAEAVQELT